MAMIAEFPSIVYTEGLPRVLGDPAPYPPGPDDCDDGSATPSRRKKQAHARRNPMERRPSRKLMGPSPTQADLIALAEKLAPSATLFIPRWAVEELGLTLGSVYGHITELKRKGLWRWHGPQPHRHTVNTKLSAAKMRKERT